MEFNISSDLTITNTKITIDGKELTNVVGINMYASSPSKDCESCGFIDITVTTVDENNTVKDTSYRLSEYVSNKIPFGKSITDMIKTSDSIIRYIGTNVDTEIKKLSDAIITHCEENKISCPTSDILYSRSLTSLKDKASDLGITLTDDDNKEENDTEETNETEENETEENSTKEDKTEEE